MESIAHEPRGRADGGALQLCRMQCYPHGVERSIRCRKGRLMLCFPVGAVLGTRSGTGQRTESAPSPLGAGQYIGEPVRLLDAPDMALLSARRHNSQAVAPHAIIAGSGLRDRWLRELPRGRPCRVWQHLHHA